MEEHQKKRIILYGDGYRPNVRHAIQQTLPLAKDLAEDVKVCTNQSLELCELDFDLLINFGGDGSIIRAIRTMRENQVPVVGVNFGKVGFLANFDLPALLINLEGLLAPTLPSNLQARQGIILHVEIQHHDGRNEEHFAINDAVVSSGKLSRLIDLECRINGNYVTQYHADGVIVASPTGSTAHSLSAGGPILDPEIRAIVLTPICPHTLAVRPLVIPSSHEIELEVVEAREEIGVTIDGQDFSTLEVGDTLIIRAFHKPYTLFEQKKPDFYDHLRSKLLWGGHVERLRMRNRED